MLKNVDVSADISIRVFKSIRKEDQEGRRMESWRITEENK